MTVHQAISDAEALLPGTPSAADVRDPRWQAIIVVGQFVQTDPEPIWQFICRWVVISDDDLRAALATCLLEHLLAQHFGLMFPRVEMAVRSSSAIADLFARCWKSGQAELPANSARWDHLQQERKS